MAARTFRDVWSYVALHVPGAPVGLAQQWVQDAYEDLCGRRHWSFLRTEALITTQAARAVDITFTQASSAITSAAGFLATDIGRQIRVSQSSPFYTINTVVDPSTATLTELYAGDSGAVSATITDLYLVMPENFRSFHEITDANLLRPIAWWLSREYLDALDPGRIMSDGRFRALASNGLSTVTSLSGRITYEAYPRPTSIGTYRYQYFKRADQLADDDLFQGPLATMTNALQKGALAEAAKWPGTTTQKNPYFNPQLAATLSAEFQVALKQIDVLDDDIYLMDLMQVDLSRYGFAAPYGDTQYLRASDATTGDYFGGFR